MAGRLDRADLTECDAFYQQPYAADGRIVIIGIDRKALETYAPIRNGAATAWPKRLRS